MEARLRSWWQRIKGPLEIIIIGIFFVALLILIVLIVLGYLYNWNWAGLGAVNSEPKQHMKTLWDWLQLLIIPAVLAIGGYLFNLTVSRNEQKSTRLRDRTERDIASDNQREHALQAYIDKMSELLLHENLRNSTEDDEVRKIARVRTLTVLPRLDSERKRSVLQFLYESALIEKDQTIIDLSGADLRKANLDIAELQGANLSGAKLMEADLSGANLFGANLYGAVLYEADLNGANLTGANLDNAILSGAKVTGDQLDSAKSLKDATMPDGSKHP